MSAAVRVVGVVSQGILPAMDAALIVTLVSFVGLRIFILSVAANVFIAGCVNFIPLAGIDNTRNTVLFAGHEGIFVIDIVGGDHADLRPHVAVTVGAHGGDAIAVGFAEHIERIIAIPVHSDGLVGDLAIHHRDLAVGLVKCRGIGCKAVVAICIQRDGCLIHQEIRSGNGHGLGIVKHIDHRSHLGSGHGEGCLQLAGLAIAVAVCSSSLIDAGNSSVGRDHCVCDHIRFRLHAGNGNYKLGAGVALTDVLGIDLICILGFCIVEASDGNHTVFGCCNSQGHPRPIRSTIDHHTAGCLRGVVYNRLRSTPGDRVACDGTGHHGNGDGSVIGEGKTIRQHILQDGIGIQRQLRCVTGDFGRNRLENRTQTADTGSILVVICFRIAVGNMLN